MLIHINGIDSKTITSTVTFNFSQPNNTKIKDFPALVMDRYSGINGVMIWSRVGEENADNEYVYDVRVGAFCPISREIKFFVDLNHDYTNVS